MHAAATTNRLFLLSPGITIFPCAPPFRTPSRVSRRKLRRGRWLPWQRTQEALKRGAISLSNVRSCLSEAGGSLLTSILLMSQLLGGGASWAVAGSPASSSPKALKVMASFVFIFMLGAIIAECAPIARARCLRLSFIMLTECFGFVNLDVIPRLAHDPHRNVPRFGHEFQRGFGCEHAHYFGQSVRGEVIRRDDRH